MTQGNDRNRTPVEVEQFLADLEEDQADRRELEEDDDLKHIDRTASSPKPDDDRADD